MLVVLPFCASDSALTRQLLKWCCELGRCKNHKALLVADAGMKWTEALEIHQLAGEAFDNPTLITTNEHYSGWPEAANRMFYAGSEHIHKYLKEPFLWLEPDCVPLKSGWLDKIAAAYQGGYLGHIYKFDNPNGPFAPIDVMSGVAVYPVNAFAQIGGIIKARPKNAWDVSAAGPMTKFGTHTNLIHHFFGQKGLPPTFVSAKVDGSPINAKTVAEIHPEAVLFHRNKDGSLINLLGKRMTPEQRFVVVFGFCDKDAGLMIANLDWVAELGRNQFDTAVLSYDRTVSNATAQQIAGVAARAFGQVIHNQYPTPPRGEFVFASRWAFRHAAKYMEQFKRPWLWYESDFWATKRGWLEKLQREYRACGRACMGSVVPNMGHVNGTAVYPADAHTRFRSIHQDDRQAFDMGLRDEMKGITHDASGLMQHVWVSDHGRLRPHGAGQLPNFREPGMVEQLLPTAVTFHRAKDLSLRDRLRERKA